METIEIKKDNALKAYNKADKNVKEVLEELLGKQNLIPQDITERIKNFKDACEYFNLKTHGDAYALLKLTKRKLLADVPIEQCDDVVLRLEIQIHALNEGVFCDLTNTSKPRWYPYFNKRADNGLPSGFGLSGPVTYYVYEGSYVGSRLCLHSEKNALYAGIQFRPDYEEFFIPQNY